MAKQCIELIIKDVLHSNPKLEFHRDIFVNTTKKQKIQTEKVSITFYPGFVTSFMETDKGNYLNVTLKNKIIQNETIYNFIKDFKNLGKPEIQKIIRNELISGDTKSCGCLHQSFGSYRIEQILNQYNIPFEKEKTFETCRFPDTKEKGRFDFFINGKLVEFDGKQHYEFVGGYFTQ